MTDTVTLLRTVADFYHVTADQMAGPQRHHWLVHARHVFIHLARKYLRLSLCDVAFILRRDHSTILYGQRKVEALLALGHTRLAEQIAWLERDLKLREAA